MIACHVCMNGFSVERWYGRIYYDLRHSIVRAYITDIVRIGVVYMCVLVGVAGDLI